MRCKHLLKGGEFPCGQCLPCRIRVRAEWTFRLMLEARKHDSSVFVTLTYDDDHAPAGYSLDPEHLKAWLKRVRDRISPLQIRFYGVGEYGDTTQRPHYHVILYGIDSSYRPLLFAAWHNWCRYERFTVEPLTVERAQYCCGYQTKKMTKKDDSRLYGRHPEFSRQSLKPGIGATAVPDIAKSLLTNNFAMEFLREEGDVPAFLTVSGRSLPLGRYVRDKLRNEIQNQTPDFRLDPLSREKARLDKEYKELLALWQDCCSVAAFFEEKNGFYSLTPEDRDAKVEQKLRNRTARFNINKQGRSL